MAVLTKNLKIATLNLCLGLKNKKDLVKDILNSKDLDIMLMQETEIEADFDCELLRIPGFILEMENNNHKKRVGIYIKSNINYKRLSILEGENNHLVVIEVKEGLALKRIINIYRSFNPNGLTQREQFLIQCEKISLACNKDTIIIGDMNLDYNRRDDVNYQYGQLFEVFNDKLSCFNLLQLVNFDTWFRTVGAVNRSSLLDHIYVPDVISVTNITHETPMFGDHQLVMANLCVVRPQPQITVMRDWRYYSKERLCSLLGAVDWTNNATDVQQIWNDFETKLITVVDELVPVSSFVNGKIESKPPQLSKEN